MGYGCGDIVIWIGIGGEEVWRLCWYLYGGGGLSGGGEV